MPPHLGPATCIMVKLQVCDWLREPQGETPAIECIISHTGYINIEASCYSIIWSTKFVRAAYNEMRNCLLYNSLQEEVTVSVGEAKTPVAAYKQEKEASITQRSKQRERGRERERKRERKRER